MVRHSALALLISMAFVASSLAQDGPVGIAFAYAPEQGSGMCTGGNPTAALDCAREKCTETGALASDCARVAWCFPSGWSFVVGVMHKEGIHWSEFGCGWPSREAAIAAANVRCDLMDRDYIQDCVVGGLWDEDGNEIVLE
jgi:hypothetical protein